MDREEKSKYCDKVIDELFVSLNDAHTICIIHNHEYPLECKEFLTNVDNYLNEFIKCLK